MTHPDSDEDVERSRHKGSLSYLNWRDHINRSLRTFGPVWFAAASTIFATIFTHLFAYDAVVGIGNVPAYAFYLALAWSVTAALFYMIFRYKRAMP